MHHGVRTAPGVGVGGGKAVKAEARKQAGAGPWRPWSHAAELGLHSAISGSHLTFCEERSIRNTVAGLSCSQKYVNNYSSPICNISTNT